MSWNVGDDEWLADPAAAPASGPVDPLDDRAMRAIASGFAPTPQPPPAAEPFAGTIPTLVATKVSAPFEQAAEDGLPPPPYSAAFDADDADSYTSSYESGSFVADSEAAPTDAAEPEPDFHIPTLALGVQSPSEPEPDSEPEPEPASEPAAFVIPTLSAAPAIVADADEDEGVEEGQSDDLVIPELVERIDSAELVLEPDPTPGDPDADVVVESPPAAEHTGFVIPTLARSEAVDEETPSDDPYTDDDDDTPVVGITPAEILLPLLARPVAEDTVETEAERSGEELAEVDAESIESLDAADLEEVEQPVAVAVAIEPEEARPPAPPPEAKAQGKRRKAWYDDVFAEHFLFLYPLTWEETCQRDAQFIFEQLAGREGLTVLDIGCGEGSHAVELAKLGARVTGIDNSLAQLLAAAQTKEAAEIEDGVEFIHGDMRRLPRDREFDAVMCIGTTLGYFEEEQNWLCLQEMHDRLRPGGRLLIHVFNRDFVAPHLPSRSWWQGKRCMVIDEAEMNFFANRLRVHRTIIFDDGRQYEHYMFMRAYTVQDLGKAISQLGMRVIEVSGSRDTRGRFFGSASPDIWITAEKK